MFILKISLRNLFRQKRRNILLGMAMSFGVMILIIASSFSHGISDIMFNKVVRYVAGQVGIRVNEKSRMLQQIFRDKDRMLRIVNSNREGITEIEEAVAIFARGIGNGRAENIVVVGADTKQNLSEETRKEYESSFKMLEGTVDDLNSTSMENPVIISNDKADELNVKMKDIVRLRFRNVFGQEQAARLTVAGIMKNDNIFMSGVVFIDLNRLKNLMGYKPWEMGNLNITVRDPKKNAVAIADRLHKALTPGLAAIFATFHAQENAAEGTVLPFKNDDVSKKIIMDHIRITDGNVEDALGKKGVMVTGWLARQLKLKPGDEVEALYENKFDGKTTTLKYTVNAVFQPDSAIGKDVFLVNERLFFRSYYENLPKPWQAYSRAFVPTKGTALYPAVATEWVLLKRTANTDEFKKKYRELTQKKWAATTVDVTTMYESASDVLKLEHALNLITLVAVMVLFFIILIGVVNTLQMTIRERTREIGTMRAIGMQKNDVRKAFIMETFFLTVAAAIVGVLFAFFAMEMLSKLTINMKDNPLGMLLVNGHLHFVPTLQGVLMNIMMILAITLAATWFPAKRAANLSAAEAFRHYE